MKHGKSVAIVGVGGLFPKSPTLKHFWTNITDGVDTSSLPPKGRWLLEPEDVFDPAVGAPDRIYSQKGCFIDDEVDQSVPEGLDINPEFLGELDPMFGLLLRAGRQAFFDGITTNLDRSRTGLIIGNLALPSEKSSAMAREYLGRTFEEKLLGSDSAPGTSSINHLNRYVAGLPAGILAKSLGLGGTCFTLDAACASSIYAIKLAADELLTGRADAMLTGGLSRPDSLYTQMGFSQLRALSRSGRCSPFDEKGDGLVVGEGCGMFLLKRTEDALRDGDNIYAVIRGIGLSNDLGGSLLAPDSEGQLRAMRAAYQQAGWSPSDVDVIECHATGTPVGDAVEFSSLKTLWGDEGWRPGQCVIGSVKSNIGHLLTAAGSAALIKTLLSLKDKTLAPTANYSNPAKGVDIDASPFRVLDKPTEWKPKKKGEPRRAAISAFGFGGINAHLLVEEWLPNKGPQSSVAYHPTFAQKNQPVAIVGMDAHFGQWDSLDSFRQRVLGSDKEVQPGQTANWWGSELSSWFKSSGLAETEFKGFFVPEVSSVPGTFRIPPKELEEMLPRQLLMLKVAGEALSDAGLKGKDLLFTGVFIGTGLDPCATNFSFRWGIQKTALRWAEKLGLKLSDKELSEWIATLRDSFGPALTANRTMGALGSIVASRIAKEFHIGGPSFTLSSEDNSGLRALEVGIRALQDGSINRAIVGASDMAGDIRAVLAQHEVRPYSKSGLPRPFDKDADGAVIGEGAAAVVLKRLEDARQDGDRIYAVINGIGTAIGGTVEDRSPGKKVYAKALERTFASGDISADSVSYLETNGSGYQAEDEMEANALGSFFAVKNNENPCYVGSVKADIGHAGEAAGIASIVKTALCLSEQILPPIRNLETLRYEWVRSKRAFLAPTSPQFWMRNRGEGPRRALVSSFGIDGSCSHALLEGFDGELKTASVPKTSSPLGLLNEGLFSLEADRPAELLLQIDKLESLITKDLAEDIDALAALWLKESPADPLKELSLVTLAGSKDELLEQLAFASASIEESPGKAIGIDGSIAIPSQFRDRIFYNLKPLGTKGKIAFVFPGSGNHFAGMGRELSARWPEIYRSQDGKSEYLAKQFLPEHFWQNSLAESIHDEHNRLVIGQVALGTAISDLARSFGLEPQAVIGYSLGETAGLFSFAAWRDRDGMSKRLRDSTLFTEELAGECRSVAKTWGLKRGEKVDWVMGIVDAPARDVKTALKGKKKAYLLIVNTHRECIVGGDRSQVEALVEELGCHFIVLRGVTTVHCEVAEPVSKPYRDLHVFETTPPEGIDFYSSALGRRYELTSESAADVILGQALETVDYTRVIEQAYDDGVRIFLEMGPGNSCSRMISSILEGRPHMARAACFPGQDATSLFLRFLARCAAERIPVDLGKLYPEESMHSAKEEHKHRIFTTIGGKLFHPTLPPPREVRQPEMSAAPVVSAAASHSKRVFDEATAAQVATVSSAETSFVSEFEEASRLKLEAHEAYLRFSEVTTNALTENISLQMSILQKMVDAGEDIPAGLLEGLSAARPVTSARPATPARPDIPERPDIPVREVAFDRDMCMEFAVGSIARMLGPEFAEVDTYPTRVRLPDEPLMLVDRIISVEGEPRSMTSGRVVTEHDVTADRWYLDGGRIPTCVAVEAGQADLFLSGYLGIDFIGKGKAVYRLLDAVVTFHRGLPVVGEVIHYDIKIERFFKQDKTYLFNFSFEGTVNGEPLLSMQKGCAGFFTEEELAAGKGIVHTKLDLMEQPGKLPDDWRELLPMAVESYDEDQVDALYAGDLKSCFGPAFDIPSLTRPYTLPGGLLKLVDRVVKIDPKAGRYGLGQIIAEMDIDPKDWFLVCHFVDDRVMPGTLMYECCMHTLRIYLLRMGWVGQEGETWCEPIPGVDSGLKCRGQVKEETKKVTYQVSIKELGYMPEPFAIVDALMFADGKAIVEIPNMSVRLSGLDRNKVEGLWNGAVQLEQSPQASQDASPKKILYSYEQILAFAVGKPSEAFGEPYKIFDEGRKIARLPGPPFQFMDRVTYIEGEPWKLVEGAVVEAEYDVPKDAWYFGANRQKDMPFSVLLETGLQPCGWLAGYLGSALTSPIDLSFRNLDGNAVQHRPVTAESGTLTTRVKITRVSSSGGMIIQSYDFEISDREGPVYTGDTVFGFFSKESLAQQVGVRDAVPYKPTADETARGEEFNYPMDAPYPEEKMRMIDSVSLFVKDGGPEGLGFIRGTKKVDPDEWFFKAHFFEDPVCPGSLGLESFVQLMKVVAVNRWGADAKAELESIVLGEKHKWTYRGQIIPANDLVTVEAVVTGFDDERKMVRADGFLSVDGKVIYQMKDFTVRVRT